MFEYMECFKVSGHENIRSSHRSTLEFTKDAYITKRGDCILGINCDKSCIDISDKLRNALKKNTMFQVRLKIHDVIMDEFYGYGHSKLVLTNTHDMVFRKSEYICDRTIMIKCTKASIDIKREIVEYLRNRNNQMVIEIFQVEE